MDNKPDIDNLPINNLSTGLPTLTPTTKKCIKDQSYNQKQAKGGEDT